MFFPFDDVIEACSGDLSDPKYAASIVLRFLGPDPALEDPTQNDMGQNPYQGRPEILLSFLRNHLPVENQKKIRQRLCRIAEEHGARISDFRWWDIMPGEHALVAYLLCGERAYNVSFYWKRSDKDDPLSADGTKLPKPWGDPTSLEGLHIDFAAPTYQKVKALFSLWLTSLHS